MANPHRDLRRLDLIAIGASAGGIPALNTIFASLPRDLPATIFTVLHRRATPNAFSSLAEILNRKSVLELSEPRNGEIFTRGHIYLAPPDRHMIVADDTIYLRDTPRQHHTRPALDPLFVSLAETYGPRVLGIVLTGMGHDGVEGMRRISQCGGITMAQDPAEAEQPSMPEQAIRKDDVSFIAPIAAIATLLDSLTHGIEPEGYAEHREAL